MTEQSPSSEESSSDNRLVVQVVLRTDVGLVRSENQDFGILSAPDDPLPEDGARLMMVADGMGGHRGGATASRLAANTVKQEFLHRGAGDDLAASLKQAFEQANATVFNEAQRNPDLRGMGTTGSALVIRDGRAFFAHVGDSRIYLVRDDTIRQLTDDHSLVASMVREGLLTPKEAETHPRRNVLQRSIGVSDQVEVDVSDSFAVQKGDTFILCSDGLHGLVKEEEIKEIARLQIEDAADKYVRLVLDRGAPDNVTVIIARVADAATMEKMGEPESERKTDPLGLDTATRQSLADGSHRERMQLPADSRASSGGRGLLKWVVITAIVIAAAVTALYNSRKPASASTGTAAPGQTNT
jgi:serine/threonine protein phosphatase PrpC